MKGKSGEGDSCLKLSAWAYAEEAYDCHLLGWSATGLIIMYDMAFFHLENAFFICGDKV